MIRKVLILLTILALLLAFAIGCGKKEAEETEKVPEEVKQAEQMDSTRMDSAMMDTAAMDTAAAPADSM